MVERKIGRNEKVTTEKQTEISAQKQNKQPPSRKYRDGGFDSFWKLLLYNPFFLFDKDHCHNCTCDKCYADGGDHDPNDGRSVVFDFNNGIS